MGTNYYLHKESKSTCQHCGHDPEKEVLHIGKSSYGWNFALHVIPEIGINSLDDWKREWSQGSSYIEDEYGRKKSPEEMLEVITNRGNGRYCSKGVELTRHEIDQYCISNGDGTWDCIMGIFS